MVDICCKGMIHKQCINRKNGRFGLPQRQMTLFAIFGVLGGCHFEVAAAAKGLDCD